MTMRLDFQTMRIPVAMLVVISRQNSDIFRGRVIRVLADPVFRLRMPVMAMDWGKSRNNIMHCSDAVR